MSDVKYGAELCERLEREAREDAATIEWADDHFANGKSWPECGHDEATCPCFTENDKARSVLAKATLRTRSNLSALADQLAAARAEIERYGAFAKEVGCALGCEGEPLADIEQAAWMACGTVMAAVTTRTERDALQSERDAMRLVVEAAEKEIRNWPDSKRWMLAFIRDAIDVYRAARGKEDRPNCLGKIRTQPSNVECVACGKYGQACDRTRKP